MLKTTLFISFILILSSSCSSKKVREAKGPTEEKSNSTAMPNWVNNPDDACGLGYLCAVSEGTGMMLAKANARKEMAQIFEVRVKSNTTSSSYSSSKSDGESFESEGVSETYQSKIQEISDEVLKGVTVASTWEDPDSGNYFALSKLKKSGAKRRFKSEMDSLDEKMIELYKDGKRSSLNKILSLLKVRENLNKRYEVVSMGRYPRKLSLEKVMAAKRKKAQNPVTVFFDASTFNSNDLSALISRLLTDNDYLVSKSSEKKYDFKLKADFSVERQHINVKGWEKYKFLLKLKALNKSGKNVGALNFSESKSGRSEKHAYEAALPAIKNYLKENLNQLSMD